MKIAWSIISIIFLLIIGILIGKTIQCWPIFTLKTEIDTVGAAISLLSLAVTLGVAYWVATILESTKEANRVEKDLFIKRIDDIYLLIEDTSSQVALQQIEHSLAVSSIKRISVNILSVIDTIATTGIKVDDTHRTNIVLSTRSLNTLLTSTPRLTQQHLDDIPLEVREGIILMSTDRRLQIDSEFDKLKRLIFTLELAINKA